MSSSIPIKSILTTILYFNNKKEKKGRKEFIRCTNKCPSTSYTLTRSFVVLEWIYVVQKSKIALGDRAPRCVFIGGESISKFQNALAYGDRLSRCLVPRRVAWALRWCIVFSVLSSPNEALLDNSHLRMTGRKQKNIAGMYQKGTVELIGLSRHDI